MEASHLFKFCPRCGAGAVEVVGNCLRCDLCAFQYYLNTATAAGALIVDSQGRILLVRRMRDPAKGKYTVPGGFVDAGESAEAAVTREVREEVGLEVLSLQYLCSGPNQYHYKGVTYAVLDFYFVATVRSFEAVLDHSEVESHLFLKPDQINPDDLAFDSVRHALRCYRQRLTGTPGN